MQLSVSLVDRVFEPCSSGVIAMNMNIIWDSDW